MWAQEQIMAHAAIAFTDQGTSTTERAKNIISPAVEHASHFEHLRFMREGLKAEKDRLQLLLNLTTQVSPDVELRQLLRTASATIHHITQCAVVAFHFPDKKIAHCDSSRFTLATMVKPFVKVTTAAKPRVRHSEPRG
jgi:hypothetical protein